MNFRMILLSLCVTACVTAVYGQSNEKNVVYADKRHEIRLSVSDGLTQGVVDILGMGLEDAVLGSKRTDEKYSLVYGLGYRYALNRFRVGADLGFSHNSSRLIMAGEKEASLKEREWNFLVMPAAEFVYFKRGLIELYGSAGAGVSLIRHQETGLTAIGKKAARKSDFSADFSYQVNPIALRVGNDRIGGFLEGGLGHRGFVTAGVSLRF